jgi:DNA-binding FrmR family transcriptional regulator
MIEIAKVILSWPSVCIVALLVLRRPISGIIQRLIHSDSGGEAEIGPIKIKLGKMAEEGKKAVHTLNKISMVMAASRRLELEILSGGFAAVFADDQNAEMRKHIEELAKLTKEAEQSLAAYGEPAAAEG